MHGDLAMHSRTSEGWTSTHAREGWATSCAKVWDLLERPNRPGEGWETMREAGRLPERLGDDRGGWEMTEETMEVTGDNRRWQWWQRRWMRWQDAPKTTTKVRQDEGDKGRQRETKETILENSGDKGDGEGRRTSHFDGEEREQAASMHIST